MTDLKPFANESQTLSVGGLSVENRLDRVSLFGNVDLTKDKCGLEYALLLKVVIDSVVATLKLTEELPDEVAPPVPPTGPRDPFA